MGALLLGTMAIAAVHGLLAGRETVNLYEGTAIAVAVAGSALFPFWGWASTLAILGILLLWSVVGGLRERFDRN